MDERPEVRRIGAPEGRKAGGTEHQRTKGPEDWSTGRTEDLKSGEMGRRWDEAPEDQRTGRTERRRIGTPEGRKARGTEVRMPVLIASLWHNYAGEFADLQQKTAFRLFSVDPPGLEPGLCGTKIRCVANYTMGQSAPDKALQT